MHLIHSITPLGTHLCQIFNNYDSHISFNNSCSNNSTLNEYESLLYNYIFMRFLTIMHMEHPEMGPIWDPLVPNFHYDFHISFDNSCTNKSTLNEYESEY